MSLNKTFGGKHTRLILSFDVGNTYSRISYSILEPGEVPIIQVVTKSGESKIPTVIYYDRQGRVQAVGAEATRDDIHETAADRDWVKAEWFNLHLQSSVPQGVPLDLLPPNKSVVDVLSDFLQHLLECARVFIQETHPNDRELWDRLRNDCYVLLSHPNGWGGEEQSRMRKAAIRAKLMPDTENGRSKLVFITEGEAFLHYAIENLAPSLLLPVEVRGVVVVDAGEGTIDVSAYKRRQRSASCLCFEEIGQSQSNFHGSVFVSMLARKFLQDFLSESPFLEDVDHILRSFDKTAKVRFTTPEENCFIRFGNSRDTDSTVGIRYGTLELSGQDVATFFRPSIDCIIRAVEEYMAGFTISHVVLVNSFAASDYLFNQTRTILGEKSLKVVRPDILANEVSSGAISFYLNHYVRSRLAKFTYGIKCSVEFQPEKPEHIRRGNVSYQLEDGSEHIPGAFVPILEKGTAVSETQEYRLPFQVVSSTSQSPHKIDIQFVRYTGRRVDPEWLDTEEDSFVPLGSLSASIPTGDLGTNLVTLGSISAVVPNGVLGDNDAAGHGSVQALIEIVVLFGLTEFKALICWKEEGVEHTSPAAIVVDEDD